MSAPMMTTGTPRMGTQDPPWMRRGLIAVAVLFLSVVLVVPLALVFHGAFEKGWGVFAGALADPDTLAALGLTLTAAAASVAVNTVFGVAAAWAVTKFEFRGKNLLLTLIDLPFSISPVVAGLLFVLLFGAQGWFGSWLLAHDVPFLFALPGILMATAFVTFPFVARELIPLMQEQGTDEEESAMVLGAGGLQTFLRVTLPNIRWGLLYGIILCNARAMGEFGAVSVVSGHIRGLTTTLPLQVEILYNEYAFAPAFAVAALLALMAVATLLLKNLVEWRARRELDSRRNETAPETT